ncbi:hypothetical protein [Aeromonas veronii]|uniref:hypothetical protein n=1 Tax=Aeromonas veronii TaxID=654 RepID=UPI003D2429AB
MSHIGISLSANTASYVKRIKEAQTETDRNLIKMEKRLDEFAQDVNKNFTSVGGSIDAMLGGLRNLKGGGYIVAVAGLGVAAATVVGQMKQLASQTIETQKEIKIAAERSKVSADEIQRWGMVTSTVGLSLEKFGDINKDVFDKMGDYATTGGGAFVDFFDVVKDKSDITISELQKLSGPDVLMKVVEEMERVGASGSQMTWVLESLGNDASNLLPLLRDNAKGFKELKARLDEMETVPEVLVSATTEVQLMDAAFGAMWNNFGVLMTNQFEGLFKYLSDGAIWVNNFFAGINKNSQIEYQMEMIKAGSLSITGTDTEESLQHKYDAIMQIAKEGVDLNGISSPFLKEISKLESRLHTWKQSGKKSAEEMEALENSIIDKRIQSEEAKADAIKAAAEKAYGTELKLIKDIQSARGFKANDVGMGQEYADKTFKADKADSAEKHSEEKEKLNKKLVAAIAEKDKAEKHLLDLVAAKDKATTKEGKDTIEAEIKKQRKVVESHIAVVKTGNESIEKLDKDEANRKKKVADDAAKLVKDEARQQKEISDRQITAQLEAAQREIDSAQTTAERIKAIEKKKLLDLEQLQSRYHANLKQRITDGSNTEEQGREEAAQSELLFEMQREKVRKEAAKQLVEATHSEEIEKLNLRRQFATTEIEERRISHDIQLQELERQKDAKLVSDVDFNNKKAQLQREFEENESTLKMAHFLDSETIEMMNAQIEMERIREQYANNLISEEEFAKQRIEIEERVANAKRAFATAQLDTLAGTFGQMASMSEEGSKRQKAALIAQQAATLASMTMNQWAAWSNIDAPDSPYKSPLAAGIAKAAVIAQYAAGLANVGAALGQFHSGSDEVDQTGSYILQSGERVVQRAANKDLTSFLESNQAGSGAVTIDAPLVIEGDTTIDENRLLAMLVKQREQITKAVKMAQRENPSLR